MNSNIDVIWAPQKGPQEILVHCPYRLIGFGGARGGGKGLSEDTLIPTMRGWVMMKDVLVGDVVFDKEGQPTTVTFKSPETFRDCYEITFDNGQKVIADDVHRWITSSKTERVQNYRLTEEYRAKRRLTRKSTGTGVKPWLAELNSTRVYDYKQRNTGTVRSTLDILATLKIQGGRETNHAIVLSKPPQYPDKKLPIAPYVLGAWLGDGISSSGSIVIGKNDFESIQILESYGYTLTKTKDPIIWKLEKLALELKQLGVKNNKHIPEAYLQSSYENRLELLRGLLDTDGCCNKDGQIEFSNTRKELSDGVFELLASLGCKPVITSRVPKCGNTGNQGKKAWYIKATTTLKAFKLTRKLARLPSVVRETQRWHFIVDIKKVESVPTYCIAVDSPSHTYQITKSHITTHNTDGVLGKYGIKQERYGKAFNAVFFRREMPGADDLIDRARELYEPIGATFNKVERQFTFRKGGRLRFRPLFNDEDASKYQGQNLSDAAVEEAGNYPDKSPIFKLFGALRSSAGVPVQLVLTFNPGGPGHYWLRELFVKPAPLGLKTLYWTLPTGKKIPYIYIPSRVGDNPILLANDPTYIDSLHMVGSPELVRAWLEGDFEIHEGSYFPEFGQRHIIDPISIPKHWPKYCGFDWGYNSPFCAVWGAVSSGKDDNGNELPYPKGAIIIYREYTGKGIINEEIADKIATLSKDEECVMVADTQIFNNMGGKSIADQFHDVFRNYKNQAFWRPADKDRINGWQQIRMRLGKSGSVPMLYFFSNCRYLLDTLPGLSIDVKNPEDLDTTGNDHGADALRYLLMERQMESNYKSIKSPIIEKGVVNIAKYIQDYRRQMQAPKI